MHFSFYYPLGVSALLKMLECWRFPGDSTLEREQTNTFDIQHIQTMETTRRWKHKSFTPTFKHLRMCWNAPAQVRRHSIIFNITDGTAPLHYRRNAMFIAFRHAVWVLSFNNQHACVPTSSSWSTSSRLIREILIKIPQLFKLGTTLISIKSKYINSNIINEVETKWLNTD